MSKSVTTRRDADIAIIECDNPPVNALSHHLRVGIAEALKAAAEDTSVKAAVLACKGRTFISGADITEFGKTPQPPSLIDLINQLDGMQKPVVAAIHGAALGGGLELALGCHYRIAAKDARVGLPEVKLGLLPGAGGTQRLPRAIGAIPALKMIVSGDPIKAAEALKLGAIDGIAEGDLVAAATAKAREAAGKGGKLPRLRDREDKLADVRANPKLIEEAAADLTKRARGLAAPAACVKAVSMVLDTPIDEALKKERAIFIELMNGDQSKAQRHLFFAEREAAKIPDMPAGTKERPVAQVAVIGAGTMGGGIAMSFANAGIPVTLIETTQEALDRGLKLMESNWKASAARSGMSADDVARRVGLIKGAIGIPAAAGADLVVEAVFEEMELKKKIFGELDKVAKKGAVLATNTSTLDVDAIASVTGRPGDVLGMHFFSPANVMKLVEIVRGKKTAHDALLTAQHISRKIAKVPVVVGVCDGFVGNRMLAKRSTECERLILEGALPQDVDAAVTAFGFPMGPFAMSDLAGNDVGWRIRKGKGLKAVISDQLCEMGRFGQKTGKGYFIYEQGSRVPRPDPEVEQIILAAAAKLGIKRRPISKEEITERMIYPMINEGARILEEGMAMRPGDIDVIWIYGYGFPVFRGGPMHYADTVGLKPIAERLSVYARMTGDKSLEPAKLLANLAAEGKTFAAWKAKA